MIYIKSGERQLINLLYYETKPVSLEEIQEFFKKSKRMIYYYIEDINVVLKSYDITPIQTTDSGYFFDEVQKEKIPEMLESCELVLTPNERVSYLICFIAFKNERISIETLTTAFSISRNVILNDLLEVREILNEYQLNLESDKLNGYSIIGDIFRRRCLFITHLKKLLRTLNYKSLDLFNIDKVSKFYKKLDLLLKELGIEIESQETLAISFLLAHIKQIPSLLELSLINSEFLANSKELACVEKHFKELNHSENIYLALLILTYSPEKRVSLIEDDLTLLNLANELVTTFELLSCLKFENRDRLINSVYRHIQLSNYRYLYSLPSSSSLILEVKEQYEEIHNITKLCCERLKHSFPYPIFESEVTLLAIHFAANIKKQVRKKRTFNVMLVCRRSTANALLLKKEIENLFPNLNIVCVVSPSEVSKYSKENIDIIITSSIVTSFETQCEIPVISVNPILTTGDVNSIQSYLSSVDMVNPDGKMNVKDIYRIIEDSLDDKEKSDIILENIDFYFRSNNNSYNYSGDDKIELKSILTENEIIIDKCTNTEEWEQAIWRGAEILLSNESITLGYVQEMIKLVNKYGPYIVISEDIAIAHADPTLGVNKLSLVMQIFPNGLSIKGKTISILIILATPDQEVHLGIVNDILIISEDQPFLNKLISSSNSLEAHDHIQKFFI